MVEIFVDRLKLMYYNNNIAKINWLKEKEKIMINIEISYTTDEDEFPEHYGYYDNFEDAKEAIEDIKKMLGGE